MIDEKTENRGYPLPNRTNELDVDVERLRETIKAIDVDIETVTGKVDETLNQAVDDLKENIGEMLTHATDSEVEQSRGSGVMASQQVRHIIPYLLTQPIYFVDTGLTVAEVKSSNAFTVNGNLDALKMGDVIKLAPTDGEPRNATIIAIEDESVVRITGAAVNEADIDSNIAVLRAYVTGVSGGGGGLSASGNVIGVALTDEFDDNGAILTRINGNFESIEDHVNNALFNNHPAYQFTEQMYGLDEMVRIPLMYWWRGIIPIGDFAGKWGMLMSPTPNPIQNLAFKPNYVAFMKNGELQDHFDWGKYRAGGNSEGVACSRPNQAHWKNISFNDAAQKCADKGEGWHLTTAQEYDEILARMVIEKGTFQLFHESVRKSYASNIWRGIHEMAYDSYTDNTALGTYREWRDGIRMKQLTASGQTACVQVYDNEGRRTWIDTNVLGTDTNYFATEFYTGEYFDNLFIARQDTSSTAPPNTTNRAIVPDYTYLSKGSTSYPYVAHSGFGAGSASNGAFGLGVNLSPTSSSTYNGFRVARL